jgi:hypothetical protein
MLAQRFEVQAVPTRLILRDGQVIARQSRRGRRPRPCELGAAGTPTIGEEPIMSSPGSGSGPVRPDDVPLDPHLSLVRPVVPQTPQGCQECLQEGTPWVHLRLCLTCGHVGCCDSSPMRHARGHAFGVDHPIVRSFEPGESWRWCYVDELYV